jgi:PAS domain S-box-containing protein
MIEPQSDELLAYLKQEGIDRDDFQLIPHSFNPQDLIDGKVDAMSAYASSEPYSLDQAGFQYQVFTPRSAGIDFYGDNLFTSEAEIAKYPQRVKAFRNASLRGWQYAMQHQEEIAHLIASRLTNEHSVDYYLFEAKQMVPLLRQDMIEIGYMNPGRWRHIADVYADMGLLPSDLPMDKFLFTDQPAQFEISKYYGYMVVILTVLFMAIAITYYILRVNHRLARSIDLKNKSHEAFVESETRFRNFFENAADAIFIAELDTGIIIDANKAASRLMQLPRDQIIGKHHTQLHPVRNSKLSKETFYTHQQESAEKFSAHPFDNSIVRTDGSEVPVEILAAEVIIGGKRCLLGTFRDLTARKKVELELLEARRKTEESEQKFSEILNNTNIQLWAFNGTEYTYVNKCWYDYTGQPQTLLPTLDLWISKVHPDDVERSRKVWTEHWDAKTEHDNFFRLRRHDGVYRDFYCHAIPVYDDQNNFKFFQGFNIDITESVKTRNELLKVHQALAKSDQLNKTFLQNMSHEIRTPMNAILGFSNLLDDDLLTQDERKEYISIINKKGLYLMTIINDIVDISMIYNKQLEIKRKVFNLNQLMDMLLLSFEQEKLNLNKPGITLLLDKGLPDDKSLILADEVRLSQILNNLIGNALKFTSEGFVKFGYQIEQGRLLCYVEDTGTGIPEHEQKIIFDRFRQGEVSNIKATGGNGLGLAICQGLVELLEGEIWVRSETGRGSTFYVSLPYLASIPQADNDLQVQAVQQQYDFTGKTILVAEDEPANAELIRLILEKYGPKLVFVENGFDAVEMCRQQPRIDIVLMDIKMPVMDGYQATLEIKKFNSGLAIIALTAHAFNDEKQRCLEAGCNDYLSKPIDRKKLLLMVDHYLQ